VRYNAIVHSINDPYWKEEVMRARQTPGEKKMLAGPDLFDYACEVALAGIRWQNPGISAENARVMLRERLRISEKLES